MLQLLEALLQALLQASAAASKRCCQQVVLLAPASARTIGAKVLIAAATPCSSRLNLALVVAMELRLRCWPGGCGDTKTTECQVGFRQALAGTTVYTSAGENLEQELCSPDFFFHQIFVVLLGCGRRGQRKN